MNRVIKFRAWDGSDMHDDFVIVSPSITTIGCAINKGIEDMQQNSENWVIMQFTGLTDKNGKEIYEGDILKGSSKIYTYRVEYNAPKFVIHVNEYDLRNQTYDLVRPTDYEIIGNIFEHEHLTTNQ